MMGNDESIHGGIQGMSMLCIPLWLDFSWLFCDHVSIVGLFYNRLGLSFYFAMADFPSKKAKIMPRAPRIRYTLELLVESGMEDRLERLKSKLQRVKQGLRITSRTPLGNVMLMERLLNSFEESEQTGMVSESHSSLFTSSSFPRHEPSSTCDASTQTGVCEPYLLYFGENTTGSFDIHTRSKRVEDYFIASTDAARQLLSTMAQFNGKCPLCGFLLDMESFAFLRHGHAVRVSLNCAAGHSLRWFSSSIIAGKFTVNLRYCFDFYYANVESPIIIETVHIISVHYIV